MHQNKPGTEANDLAITASAGVSDGLHAYCPTEELITLVHLLLPHLALVQSTSPSATASPLKTEIDDD